MNQKRSWPGVPKRYRERRLAIVIRPKSIATVVVVLSPTPLRSSTPMLAWVSVSSVRSGRISLIAPTSVVFPTPNPPATRILNGVSRLSSTAPRASEGAEPIEHLPEQIRACLRAHGPSRLHSDQFLLDQVGEQDTHHAQRQRYVRRGVSDGHRLPAHADQLEVLGTEPACPGGGGGRPRGHDHGDQVEHRAARGIGSPPGQRIGPDNAAGFPVDPPVVLGHRFSLSWYLGAGEPGLSDEMRPGTLDQHRHLISNEASVGARRAHHRQAAAITGRGDEQECLLEFDDRLAYVTEAEVLTCAPGETLHARGQRSQMLSVLPAQGLGCGDGQAVAGKNHGMLDVVHPGGEVVKQPAQFLAPRGHAVRTPHGASCSASRAPSAESWPPPVSGESGPSSALRPRSHPLCSEASSFCAWSGERISGSREGVAGPCEGVARRCGDRFAWRPRRGRPRWVPESGSPRGGCSLAGGGGGPSGRGAPPGALP